MTLERAQEILANDSRNGMIMYFEKHRELLDDPDYNCAYKLVRNAFIKHHFGKLPVTYIEGLYKTKVANMLSEATNEKIEEYKNDVLRMVEMVKRNNMASLYEDLLEKYFE